MAHPTAKSYQRIKRRILFFNLVAQPMFFIWFWLSGASNFLKNYAQAVSSLSLVQNILYLSIFFAILYLVFLPLDFFSGFLIEKRFELSNQTLIHWILDELKKIPLGLFFFLLTAESFLFLVDQYPQTWWILVSLGWFFLSVILTRIFPKFIIPLFYKVKPVRDSDLNQRVRHLSRQANVQIKGAYEIDFSAKTKKANAALVGIGKSRRILLSDTLLKNFSADEVDMVVAHELGHHAKKHIPKSIFFNAVIAVAGFYLLYLISETLISFFGVQGLYDLEIFPILLLLAFVGGLIILPIQNALSRYHENQADEYAVSLIPKAEVFNHVMEKLSKQNFSDPNPSPLIEFIFYDHPSMKNRIKNIRNFKNSHGL